MWLTTANRILRLYIILSEPSHDINMICLYIMNVYARVWFDIKSKCKIVYGAKHLFNIIKYSRSLNNVIINETVASSIQNNGFFSHSENILLTMYNEEDEYIRNMAIARIRKARENPTDNIRIFVIHK